MKCTVPGSRKSHASETPVFRPMGNGPAAARHRATGPGARTRHPGAAAPAPRFTPNRRTTQMLTSYMRYSGTQITNIVTRSA